MKNFVEPEVNVVTIEVEDVITTSADSNVPNGGGWG